MVGDSIKSFKSIFILKNWWGKLTWMPRVRQMFKYTEDKITPLARKNS